MRVGSGSQLAMTASRNSKVFTSSGIGGAEGLALDLWFYKSYKDVLRAISYLYSKTWQMDDFDTILNNLPFAKGIKTGF